MTEVYLTRYRGGFLPADDLSADAIVELESNGPYRAKLSRPRNIGHHRKFFALLSVAFDAWQPNLTHKGQEVQASRERFRKDLLILAGYYESFFGIDGSVHLEPKSISFAAMDQPEFERLYNACIQVILDRVLTGHTQKDLEDQIERILRFT